MLPDIAAPVIFPLASTLNVPLLFFIVAPVIVEPLVISPWKLPDLAVRTPLLSTWKFPLFISKVPPVIETSLAVNLPLLLTLKGALPAVSDPAQNAIAELELELLIPTLVAVNVLSLTLNPAI